MMVKEEKKACKVCGKLYPASLLSHRGLCPYCSARRIKSAMRQLKMKHGPIYEKWRKGMKLALSKMRKKGVKK